MLLASLPMYDWAECASETQGEIDQILNAMHMRAEILHPKTSAAMQELWNSPNLLFAQTCWGAIDSGLIDHAHIIAQPDYSNFLGGDGAYYRSALIAHRDSMLTEATPSTSDNFPMAALSGKIFAYNETSSLSGYMALMQDLDSHNKDQQLFQNLHQTHSHRASIDYVAQNKNAVATIDCHCLALANRFMPNAHVRIIGWTAPRLGLPIISAVEQSQHHKQLSTIFHKLGYFAPVSKYPSP